MTKKEAVLSSKIEGTQATLTEILEIEADDGKVENKDKNKYDDFVEITNYNKALKYAENEIDDERKLSLWLIRSIHELLLNGARGKDKAPGQFRNNQNWIGKPGSTIENATYIPVSPEKLSENLDNLECYISNYEEKSTLVQIAIIHAQFEKIHPFKDGNGRIGRILIPIYLYSKKIISRPVLYISEYLEEHREEYYDKLNSISDNENTWIDWINFFLKAVEDQANKNIKKVRILQLLYKEYKQKINSILNTQNGIYVVDALFTIPVFRSSKLYEQISNSISIDRATVDRYIRKLVNNGILVAEEERDRNKKYYFKELVNNLK